MTYDQKLAAAKAWLGTRWVLHPRSTYLPTWRAWR